VTHRAQRTSVSDEGAAVTGPYPATPGYDLATGIGSFDVAKAQALIEVTDLCELSPGRPHHRVSSSPRSRRLSAVSTIVVSAGRGRQPSS
jgi:hypothetical protein